MQPSSRTFWLMALPVNPVCDQCPGEDEHVQNEVHVILFCQDHRVCELRKHFSFHLRLYLRTFQRPNPFCCNRSTTNLFIMSFLSRTLDFFSFFLSLWIHLWLAETSQQPISQTTWLETISHCNRWTNEIKGEQERQAGRKRKARGTTIKSWFGWSHRTQQKNTWKVL
jgi:hypothetical protein